MDESVLDSEIINEFQDNDEWDVCFNAIEEYEAVQDLIATANAVDEEAPRPEYLQVLQRCFGHQSFRPMQWKIISSIINDRRDNCAIMATGYGKSLCFQYPSVYLGGITIVVSPLISLMEDQVLSLTMSNISACLLGTAQVNKKQTIEEIFENKHSLVYVTPELCCGDYGHDLLRKMNEELTIILLAIDEAHCVSSWGHDFRYQYRELGKLRNIFPSVPILAVTATATPKVRTDIVSCLKLRNPQVLCSGFDRPNLQFSVYLKGTQGVFADLRKVMTDKDKSWGFPGSTIIYCITRKQTEEVADLLQKKGVKCLAYHAGMSVKARKQAHELFVKDKMKVIVATIAFGMGIDKPDVRNIIHYGASKDIESYYQEVGRAGRDGQPSICVTFYKDSDFDLHQTIREMNGTTESNRARREAMEKIIRKYLETRDCRRQFILNHFEGSTTPKKPKARCCDNCTRKLHEKVPESNKYEGINSQGLYDFTKDALAFLNCVQAMGGKFGVGMYILLLRGSNSSKLFDKFKNHTLHGSGKYQTEDWWKAIGRLLEREGYLKKSSSKKGKSAFRLSTYSLGEKGLIFIQTSKNLNATKILLQPTPEMYPLLRYKQQPIPLEEKFISKTNPLPSTSKKVTSSKHSLKLLNIPAKSDSKPDLRNNSDNLSETSETDLGKEERMKVYRLLMNKRTDIASTVDCMPYMVASNEALMKMAQMKPCTLKDLRACQLDGFTEVKLKRFGEEFVKAIRVICELDPTVLDEGNKKSIQNILAEHPLPGAKLGAPAEASYSMYKSGLTVQEIATKRGVLPATILSHLIDAIKAGYPIKMIDLNVTDEIRDIIINVIRNPPINSNMSVISPIKNACPPDITFDSVKVVIAFLQIRDHLKQLNVQYEEFESLVESPIEPHSSQMELNNRTQNVNYLDRPVPTANQDSGSRAKSPTKKVNLSSLSCRQKSEKRDAESESEDSFIFQYSTKSHPTKKQKMKKYETSTNSTEDTVNRDLDFLDSPPRTTQNDDLLLLDTPPQTCKLSTEKQTGRIDLEKSLLEDDFFDDANLDEFDKVISGTKSNTNDCSTSKLNIGKSTNKYRENGANINSDSPIQNKLDNDRKSEKISFKKFQFKSKVPLSVEQSTKNLYSHQSH